MPNDPKLAATEMRRLSAARRTSHDPWWFEIGGAKLTPDDVVSLLRPYLTDERVQRIEEVLDERTTSLAVVVEGMVDTGNIAAVMRTADGFGVQSFHAIDTAARYKHSRRTSQGAEKWLDRWRWESAAECAVHLRESGMRVLAADVSESALSIDDVDFSYPTALVFGNELEGLSGEMRALSDGIVTIPISGFVQSLSISVAAALCLDAARRDRIARRGHHGDLGADDRRRLRAVWYQKSVPNVRPLLERLVADGLPMR